MDKTLPLSMHSTFNKKQPHPSRDFGVVDLKYSKGYEPREGTGQESAAKEDRNSKSQFATRIEQRQIEDSTGKESRLECTMRIVRHTATHQDIYTALLTPREVGWPTFHRSSYMLLVSMPSRPSPP